jgi:hypothetical protein
MHHFDAEAGLPIWGGGGIDLHGLYERTPLAELWANAVQIGFKVFKMFARRSLDNP